MKATEMLIREHHLIYRMAASTKEYLDRLVKGGSVDLEFLEQVVDFITRFADNIHREKEDSLLFPVLEAQDLTRGQQRILAELREDHERERAIVDKLRESMRRRTDEPPADMLLGAAVVQLTSLVQYYRGHLQAEDRRLWPLVDQALSEEQQTELAHRFIDHDRTVSHGDHRETVEELEEALASGGFSPRTHTRHHA